MIILNSMSKNSLYRKAICVQCVQLMYNRYCIPTHRPKIRYLGKCEIPIFALTPNIPFTYKLLTNGRVDDICFSVVWNSLEHNLGSSHSTKIPAYCFRLMRSPFQPNSVSPW